MNLKILPAVIFLAAAISPSFALSSSAASKAQPDGNYRFKSDEFSALPTAEVKRKAKKPKKKKRAAAESEYFAPAPKVKGDTFSAKFDEEGNVKGGSKKKASKKKGAAKTPAQKSQPAGAVPVTGPGAGSSGGGQTAPRLVPNSGTSEVVNL